MFSAPPPKSLLGRHRLLAPSASVRVSPICFGAMSLGNSWQSLMGEVTKEGSFELLDTYYDLGGNFIDTANSYHSGESEEWLGQWLEKTGRREEMVIATKYSMNSKVGQPGQKSNFGGTGTKTMNNALRDSLKRLKTDYVDIFYVHVWDFATGIPELMHSLNNLVTQGKVLYLGVSNTPAWVVVKANAYARQHGLRPFSVYQGAYSAQTRDLEREIIPMCADEGMGILAFRVLGGGYFQAPGSARDEKGRNAPFTKVGREEQVAGVLHNVGTRHGVPLTSVSIAYVMQKTPYLFPLLGGRKVEHLKANIEALGLELTPEDIAEIESAYDFDPGYPHTFATSTGRPAAGPQDIQILESLGHFDYVEPQKPIKPHGSDPSAADKV